MGPGRVNEDRAWMRLIQAIPPERVQDAQTIADYLNALEDVAGAAKAYIVRGDVGSERLILALKALEGEADD